MCLWGHSTGAISENGLAAVAIPRHLWSDSQVDATVSRCLALGSLGTNHRSQGRASISKLSRRPLNRIGAGDFCWIPDFVNSTVSI